MLRARSKPARGGAGLRAVVRGAALAGIAASVAVPLLRKRLRVPPVLTTAAVAAGPLGTAILMPRRKRRDVLLFMQQMWAFTVVHELPYDDPERLRERLKIRYTIRADRAIGGGRLPNWRLQRLYGPDGEATRADAVLAIVHWLWFAEPHGALLYILLRDEPRFPRAATQMATAFNLGCAGYIAVPTAPPWWASENGYTGDERVERLMEKVGREVWGDLWPVLYRSLGGNPWAAMPSLHFGTSVLAAILLSESSRTAGLVGWSYASVLGVALVRLGEHYVLDLIAGLGLALAARHGVPRAAPLGAALSRAVQRLERIAEA